MIEAQYVEREQMDVRSSSDRRMRVDSYFVVYKCPADALNKTGHDWCCRFEVPRGSKFIMTDFADKSSAKSAQGFVI